MKYLVYFFLVVVCGYSLAQNKYETREEKLQQLKTRTDIKVTEVQKDIIKLEYPDGRVLYKNIGDYQHPTNWQAESSIQQPFYSPSFDSTIIDIATLDTTLYYQKYTYWQEVPLGNFRTLLVGDINNNKLPELYGQMKKYNTDYSDIVVFEINQQNKFDSVYFYDRTVIAEAIKDINKDGQSEIRILRNYLDTVSNIGWKQYLFFEKETEDTLATRLAFIFQPRKNNNSQQNDVYFGDWDLDLFTDQIYIIPCCPSSIFFYEYNNNVPNFDSVYQFDYSSIDLYYGGFSIGDFDQDNKTEFLAGSVHGKVLSIENCGNDCYAPNWQGIVQTNNAYLCGETNDLDGNGKKEIWIGGDAYYNGVGITRITLFEATGDNNYQTVGKIDLVGIFSWDAGNIQVLDLDKDGKEEVLLGLDQTVLILKFNGSMNHQKYEVFYYRRNEPALSGRNSIYYGAVLYDLNGDEKEDLIINMDEVIQNVGLRLFSYIYKGSYAVDIKDEENQLPLVLELHPSYPNPFNSTTKIKFNIAKSSFVSLKVYNSLGKEISTLLEKEISPGSCNIRWEAKDSNGNLLPSGVYLIRLTSDNYAKSIKTLLLK